MIKYPNKMKEAWRWFDKAAELEKTLPCATKEWYCMVKMSLNKACVLELQAHGFHVFHHKFQGPYLGDIHTIIAQERNDSRLPILYSSELSQEVH